MSDDRDEYSTALKQAAGALFAGKPNPGPPGVVIRHNPDKSIDEIIATGCTVSIEQMSDAEWWMGIKAPDGAYWHFWIGSKNGRSHVDVRCTEQITAAEWKAHVEVVGPDGRHLEQPCTPHDASMHDNGINDALLALNETAATR
jgi:hypothetical protein